MQSTVTFEAILSRATTLLDGGWRISFDVSMGDGEKIARIASWRSDLLQVAIVNSSLQLENNHESSALNDATGEGG